MCGIFIFLNMRKKEKNRVSGLSETASPVLVSRNIGDVKVIKTHSDFLQHLDICDVGPLRGTYSKTGVLSHLVAYQ